MAKKGPKMSFLVKSREKSYLLEIKDNKWLSWMKMLNQTCLYITRHTGVMGTLFVADYQ